METEKSTEPRQATDRSDLPVIIKDDSAIRTYEEKRQSQQREPIIIYDTHEWNPDLELEKAIEHGWKTIIIEPDELGEMAYVWIGTGNILHKIAMTCNFAATTISWLLPHRPYIYCGFATAGILSTTFYGLVWQFDPFYKYRLEKDYKERNKLPLHLVASNKPVVLVRHGTFLKTFTRYTVAFSATVCCVWSLYKLRKM